MDQGYLGVPGGVKMPLEKRGGDPLLFHGSDATGRFLWGCHGGIIEILYEVGREDVGVFPMERVSLHMRKIIPAGPKRWHKYWSSGRFRYGEVV